jgi:hypothetical protein
MLSALRTALEPFDGLDVSLPSIAMFNQVPLQRPFSAGKVGGGSVVESLSGALFWRLIMVI